MKNKIIITASLLLAVVTGGIIIAADHIDAPAVTNQSTDITDMYVFRGQNTNNLVFVANTQGLLAPSATGAASFQNDVMIEFNIDNNGDNIEDLVVQALFDNNRVRIYGPVAPSETGLRSKAEGAVTVQADITPYGAASPVVGTGSNGMMVFAGPRDDPFFFDFAQYSAIIGGTATGFNNPGSDTFAGTNVLSLVVEIPKSLLSAGGGTLNVWAETKKRM